MHDYNFHGVQVGTELEFTYSYDRDGDTFLTPSRSLAESRGKNIKLVKVSKVEDGN